MDNWKKTSCVLCAQNCGLKVLVENNTIVKVAPDKDNPRSKGYVCRKGLNIANHQHHEDRLTHPLKKTENGFVKISWEQAFEEIGKKLKNIVDEYGPKSFAYMGGGGQGCHFEAAFGVNLMRGLGSKYHYNALAQELTGYFWGCGRMFGRQNRFAIPDEMSSDMILGIGWNGMTSHQMPRAPIVLKEFSSGPDKFLAIIDPRMSDTAKIADLHLPIRPGTDALLARAMISIILSEGLENREYLEQFTEGFEKIKPWFENFDYKAAVKVCGLEYDDVYRLCKELSTRKWCMHFDLGVYMNRHSTMASYLYMLLAAVCGRCCVKGGNVIPGTIVPLGSHTDERDENTWRTVETDFPAISGAFPPNVMPEEILSDNPERLRAVVISSSNPLRSYADTTAYERAFEKLDLLVTIEIAMTETAELSDYVLPAKTGYESNDGTFFPWNFPEVYFQMRRHVVEAAGEQKESGEILTGIAEKAGIVPQIPDYLYEAAKKDRLTYMTALFSYVSKNKSAAKKMPFIIAKTLGKELGSGNLAAMWGVMLGATKDVRKNAQRAGFKLPPMWKTSLSPSRVFKAVTGMIKYRSVAPAAILTPEIAQSELMFEKVMEKPQGLWIGVEDEADNFSKIKTKSRKIELYIEEMEEWIKEIEPELEEKELSKNDKYPFILMAGRHIPENANTLMRKPDWNKGRRACTLALNPEDAKNLNIEDKEIVRISTEAGSAEIEAEITDDTRRGQVIIPHGFGLKYKGKEHGVNVNRLTKNTHRDRLAATPLHRFVRASIEKI